MIRNFSALATINGQETLPKEGFIEVENAKLFYREAGQGSPLVVLHGGPGLTQDYLLPALYQLADHNHVIFYDQRGCGRSTGEINDDSMTVKQYVEDLDKVRKSLNVEKISILGHSWGGFLAMQYAIAHPEHVDKLILSNSCPASFDDYACFEQEWIRRMKPYMKEMETIQQTKEYIEGNPEVVEKLVRLMFRRYCYNPEKADLLNLRQPANVNVNGAKILGIFNKNVFGNPFNLHLALKNLKIQTLVIHGDNDPVPPSTAQNIHDSIQGSRYILMKQCGHFPYVEDPHTYFKHLREFL